MSKPTANTTGPNLFPSTLAPAASVGVKEPADTSALSSLSKPVPVVEEISIPVHDSRAGVVPAYLHLGQHNSTNPPKTAAILLSGAGGGVTGPSGMYVTMATKLAALDNHKAIPTLRMDYRYPARNEPCVKDVLAAMNWIESGFGISRFVLVGWSFGGAPVFTVAGQDQRIVGCATVASQTAQTESIRKLAPRPVLLLHGTGDSTLSPYCSEKLYEMYGTKGTREIKLFEGDNHALTSSSKQAEELLIDFIVRCAGQGMTEGDRKLARQEMISGKDKRIETMKKGGDLRGEESID